MAPSIERPSHKDVRKLKIAMLPVGNSTNVILPVQGMSISQHENPLYRRRAAISRFIAAWLLETVLFYSLRKLLTGLAMAALMDW